MPSTDLPIALYRDEGKLHTYRGTQASKSSIDVYSCAGKLVRRINVRNFTALSDWLSLATADGHSGIKVLYAG